MIMQEGILLPASKKKKKGNWCFSSFELLENCLGQSSSGCPWDCLGGKSAAIKWGEVFLLQLSKSINLGG